jgi:predicted metal-dependent RNase
MENKIKYILILLLLVGCGTRKVNKTETENSTKTEIAISDTTKIVTNTAYNIDKVVNDFCIEPIDSTKAIVIIDNTGKKTSYLNAKIRHRREISSNKTLKSEIVQSSHKKNIKATTQRKIIVKQIERKTSIITQLWWLWLILLIILIYYINKKLNLFA